MAQAAAAVIAPATITATAPGIPSTPAAPVAPVADEEDDDDDNDDDGDDQHDDDHEYNIADIYDDADENDHDDHNNGDYGVEEDEEEQGDEDDEDESFMPSTISASTKPRKQTVGGKIPSRATNFTAPPQKSTDINQIYDINEVLDNTDWDAVNGGWNNRPMEEKCIDAMVAVLNQSTRLHRIGKARFRVSEVYKKIAERLTAVGFPTSQNAVKNEWNRFLRLATGVDERQNARSAALATSVQLSAGQSSQSSSPPSKKTIKKLHPALASSSSQSSFSTAATSTYASAPSLIVKLKVPARPVHTPNNKRKRRVILDSDDEEDDDLAPPPKVRKAQVQKAQDQEAQAQEAQVQKAQAREAKTAARAETTETAATENDEEIARRISAEWNYGMRRSRRG